MARRELQPMAPTTEKGLTYDSSLLSAILWTYPAYSQNYLFSAMTEAWLWDVVSSKVGDPIANQKVGPLLKTEIIRSSLSFPESLQAMKKGDRTAPLKAYLSTATQ